MIFEGVPEDGMIHLIATLIEECKMDLTSKLSNPFS
jgi:hypothetical protein